MSEQIEYYDQFGKTFADSILSCPEPEVWTTDYAARGRIYCEMRQRVDMQYELIAKHFRRELDVLDVGCGFGRQSVLLARNGYNVTGVDTSPVFIDIARQLCEKAGGSGQFLCADIMAGEVTGQFEQILLLDVLEHLKPRQRRHMLERIAAIAAPSAKLVLSLPLAGTYPSAWLDENLRKPVTQHFAYFRNREEHPFPIPDRREMARLTRRLFELQHYSEGFGCAIYVLERRATTGLRELLTGKLINPIRRRLAGR